MHILTIGQTQIPYTIRISGKVRKKRIVVTPEGVEVVAPAGVSTDGAQGIDAFVHRKRKWIFRAMQEVDHELARRELLPLQQYASGAKFQYRGRWLMLEVKTEDVDKVLIQCRSKFHAQVPQAMSRAQGMEATRDAFLVWLKDKAQRDLQRFGKRHQERLGVKAKAFKLSEQKHHWGTCESDGTIRVHWRLVQAPSAAMEYVIAHEVAHLVHRHHSPEFWNVLSETMPDWKERKAMLEAWEEKHRDV